jgi:hypothetical protein
MKLVRVIVIIVDKVKFHIFIAIFTDVLLPEEILTWVVFS